MYVPIENMSRFEAGECQADSRLKMLNPYGSKSVFYMRQPALRLSVSSPVL